MLDLVRFEFKKLLARRTSQVASAGILVLLCGRPKPNRTPEKSWAALRPSPSARRRSTRTRAC